MATDLDQYHLDVAGLVMREFRTMPSALDAQISLAFVVTYLCGQYEIEPGAFCHVLLNNVNEIGLDPSLYTRMTERIHSISTTPRAASSPIILTPPATTH